MNAYQLFIMTLDGQVKAQYELICADDDCARKRAKKFYTVYPVEIWAGPRRIDRIPSPLQSRREMRAS
jgi:hypothetical protein